MPEILAHIQTLIPCLQEPWLLLFKVSIIFSERLVHCGKSFALHLTAIPLQLCIYQDVENWSIFRVEMFSFIMSSDIYFYDRDKLKKANYCYKTASAAAAKSLQLCLTLCDPIDGSPPGSSVPGILQARILEWVAISFSRTLLVLTFLK